MKKYLSVILSVVAILGILGTCIIIFGNDNNESNSTSHVHNFKMREEVKNCEDGGFLYKTCSTCLYSETLAIAPSEHELENSENMAATCTDPGYSFYEYCKKCEYVRYEITEEPLGHDLTVTPGKDATCTENGYTAAEKCSRCSYEKVSTTIPSKGHDLYQGASTFEPTCTTEGFVPETYCHNCDLTIPYETIPALGHNLITIPSVEPNCIGAGHSEYQKCTREGCNYMTDIEIIDAVGHDFVKTVLSEPTCLRGTTYYSECSYCGLKTEITEKNDKISHNYISTRRDPSCVTPGVIEYTCDFCKETYYENIPATNHQFGANFTCLKCNFCSSSSVIASFINENNPLEAYEYVIPSANGEALTWEEYFNSEHYDDSIFIRIENDGEVWWFLNSNLCGFIIYPYDENDHLVSGTYSFSGKCKSYVLPFGDYYLRSDIDSPIYGYCEIYTPKQINLGVITTIRVTGSYGKYSMYLGYDQNGHLHQIDDLEWFCDNVLLRVKTNYYVELDFYHWFLSNTIKVA